MDIANICIYLESDVKTLGKKNIIASLNQVYFENRGFLNEYQVMQGDLFTEFDENMPEGEQEAARQDLRRVIREQSFRSRGFWCIYRRTLRSCRI